MSNYPIGDLYEIQDSTTYSDGESEVESELDFNDKPVEKKQRADDSFLDHLKSRFQQVRTELDELPAVDDPYREGTEDRGDSFDEAIEILAATGDGELDRNDSMDVGLKEDSDVINAPQSHENDMSHSSHMTPALAATAP